jgi:hypothetical protein
MTRSDSQLIDGLQKACEHGECPGLVTNDAGKWAVARDGYLASREAENGVDIQITHVVLCNQWHDTPRKALEAFLDSIFGPL